MIVVKIEVWPFGQETKAREIGRTYIANVRGDQKRADYKVAVCRRGKFECPWPHGDVKEVGPKPLRIGKVERYPRESYNVWRLIIRALLNAFPEEK